MPVRNYETIDTTSDVTTTTTLLHEAIPLTGTIVSGTYGNFRSERNIKNYTHGMFQSVYDYPYLSSSANHIFDITLGYDETSTLSGSSNRVMNTKKLICIISLLKFYWATHRLQATEFASLSLT